MKEWLSASRLSELLAKLPTLRVGVLGDFCLDAYFFVDMTRAQLSREAPLHNHPVIRESYSMGGAANVAWNLAGLGVCQVQALTVLGEDWRGGLLRGRMQAAGIYTEGVVVEAGRFTPFYGKVVLTAPQLQQEDARLDFINTAPLQQETEEALIERLERLLPGLDALVVADYQACGVVTDRVLSALNRLVRNTPGLICAVDSRERITAFQGMVLKPNELEAFRAVFPERASEGYADADLHSAGQRLQQASGQPVYLTLGERGCLVFDRQRVVPLPALVTAGPIDPVGAGDTFISALAAGLAAGAGPVEAGAFASLAAAVTLRKLRVTGTASPHEIQAVFDCL